MAILPVDVDLLVLEILPRLPPRTLLRFKCVNKFFYNYISSKTFINLHLQRSILSNTNRLLIAFSYREGFDPLLYTFDLDSRDTNTCCILPPPFSDNEDNDYMDNRVSAVGSCNGLICIRYHRMATLMYYIILNPSTGEICANICTSCTSTRWCYGFGYDSLKGDYKLVCVEYKYDYGLTCFERKVKVYSMMTDSWSSIEFIRMFSSSPMEIFFNPSTTCVLTDNNLLHWLSWSITERRRVISCFNVENEQWTDDIPLPDFNDYDYDTHFNDYDVTLGVLDGCLCLSLMFQGNIDVLVMKEYGVQESWAKLVSIAAPGRQYSPILAYEKNGATNEILLGKNLPTKQGKKTYEWYNVRDNTTKILELNGAPRSLVPLSLCLGSVVTVFEDGKTY